MKFPVLTEPFLEQRLRHPTQSGKKRVRMVLDTDTYNEIDDQFAVVYALLSPEQLQVEALYAAPFTNDRSTGPGDGMEKSYAEILRLLERLNVSSSGLVHRGSTEYLSKMKIVERSPAVMDLVERAMASSEDDPLYVVAIGAVTNVAAALMLEPEILRRIVVVWLGGHPQWLPHTVEFNLMQDVKASQLMFDSGVPLVQIPCYGVASHLLTTKAELDSTLKGRNAISDFLYERFCEYSQDHFAWGKEIWDISTIGYLLNEEWVPSRVVPSPVLTGNLEISLTPHFHTTGNLVFKPAPNRHSMREAWFLHRNPIFRDLFTKLQK
ncbi:MAG: nucleoside hydrolase [Anaerolineaceae bacterium]|nr:nucleoside hydrolase [Anaerolineaceae bacterium]